ncbi:type I restriction endonuclease [Priestia megaterium]|uniref:type I restriction endonuclease n=1 Tax=Priestia megaterium TaxID=1404 RepID=UPI001FB3138A|nr:type I restriction endonuclease [Priestia megaterium]
MLLKSQAFNEDTRVKIPALVHFTRLGYDYVSLKGANIEPKCKIFIDIFKKSIERINKRTFNNQEIKGLLREIRTLVENNDAGLSFYKRLTAGHANIKLIDFIDTSNNYINVVTELEFSNEGESFRPDITVLINGIPLAYFEVKVPNNIGGMIVERNRELERYGKRQLSHFYRMIQITSFSNNQDYNDQSKYTYEGSFYSTPNGENTKFQFFREEEDISVTSIKSKDLKSISEIMHDNGYSSEIQGTREFQTNLHPETPANRFITSIYSLDRFWFILQYGIVHVKKLYKSDTPFEKHIIRYPQLFGIKNMTSKVLNNPEAMIKKGVIWHTQGSGKTALAYYASRYLRDYFQKENVITKFYFVVDRIDLLQQAAEEFRKRGVTVNEVTSRADFMQDIKNPTVNSTANDDISISVVNIQKFSTQSIAEDDSFDGLNVQRIYFLDEVHRSYKDEGVYFSHLFRSDRNAVFFGLTGTPLLKEYKTTDLFGDYIHTYFYDKSIADGYTLRIKKELIAPHFKQRIENLVKELPNKKEKSIDLKSIKNRLYEDERFCELAVDYIHEDFVNFREKMEDSHIGAMIVTVSVDQAKRIYHFLNEKTNLQTALVISEQDKEENKKNQKAFREGSISVLIVYNMLITGFDAERLKRLYLFRSPKDHNLLQTITRVNRPHKEYDYGYIVDFADIDSDYEGTMTKYMEELTGDLNDQQINSFIVDVKKIREEFHIVSKKLVPYKLDNIEHFSMQLNGINKKNKVLEVMMLLKKFRGIYLELWLSRQEDLISNIDHLRLDRAIKEVERRWKTLIFLEGSGGNGSNNNGNETIVNLIHDLLKDGVIFVTVKEEELATGIDINKLISQINKLLEQIIFKDTEEFHILQLRLKDTIQRARERTETRTLNDYISLGKEFEKLKIDTTRVYTNSRIVAEEFQHDLVCIKAFNILRDSSIGIDDEKLKEILLKTKGHYNERVKINNGLKSVKMTKDLIGPILQIFKKDISFDKIKKIRDVLATTINEELENK